MNPWSKRLLRLAVEMERQLDAVKGRMGRRGPHERLAIVPYRGYGTRRSVRLKARVLEDNGIAASLEADGALRNLLNMYRRFESDEVPGARVRAACGDATGEFTADEEGFVDVVLSPTSLPADAAWHDVRLELILPASETPVTAVGSVLVPPATAGFGVISDLDDTVIQTNVGNLLRMARTVFLSNARTRVAFPGVSAFYRALQSDGAGGGFNPLFFVSSSPWNLYDLLMEFLMLSRIPLGPMILRDWGLSERGLLPTVHRGHKLEAIRAILDAYAPLPFLLIGDSSEQDPEIYAEVVAQYPGRIKAIYIRNVSRDLARPEAIRTLGARLLESGNTLVLANDTVSAARHAIEQGYISATSLPEIETVRRIEEPAAAPPTPTIVVQPAVAAVAAGGVIERALSAVPAPGEKPPTVVVEPKS
jgi:phosphatidate phosphatase APP1